MEKKEKEIGKVNHWYDKIGVAVVKLSGTLSVGDKVKVKKGEVEFEGEISSMQLDHEEIESGKKGKEVAVKISGGDAKDGSLIFKVK